MIRKPYFGGNRVLDDPKNFSRSEKLAFYSLIRLAFINFLPSVKTKDELNRWEVFLLWQVKMRN
ncbi:hypothetical protein BBF96_05610 [Anoxybacter fermentans]|uniref:Uncharacterized protein n=1 Tax=Anoxybacter fermentans TaxID=1323375 RepID=A0A3S9SXD6_9FIRM|nr:hypothetical protein BBF96_05610 [Anoxybacter fermentans]